MAQCEHLKAYLEFLHALISCGSGWYSVTGKAFLGPVIMASSSDFSKDLLFGICISSLNSGKSRDRTLGPHAVRHKELSHRFPLGRRYLAF